MPPTTSLPPNTTTDSSILHHYGDLLIGSILAVCGNLMISISLNLQKYTHMKNDEREVKIHYTRNPLWWLGMSLMVFGEIGNFSAYGYAPASVVAPLGTTTVVANMFLAAIFLKEKIRPEHLFGSTLAVVGAILIVAFSDKREDVLDGNMLNDYLTQTTFVVYICVELGMLAVLFVMLYVYRMKRVVIYLLIVSLIASFSVISAKAVSSMVQLAYNGDPKQLTYPTFYIMFTIMIATAIIQVKYLNQAMKGFESTIVVPTNFVFFTISAIVAGIVFYKEFYGLSALQIFMFLFGCIMSFIGVYFIVAGRGSADAILNTAKAKDEQPVDVSSKIFPFHQLKSWLLATVNVGQVQPSGMVTHLVTDDEARQPFITEDDDEEDEESQNTLYNVAESNGTVAK